MYGDFSLRYDNYKVDFGLDIANVVHFFKTTKNIYKKVFISNNNHHTFLGELIN